jgi:hypothetical protein
MLAGVGRACAQAGDLVAGAANRRKAAEAEASPMTTLRGWTISLLKRIAPDLADRPLTIGHTSELDWVGDACDGFTGPGTAMAMGVSGSAIVINDRAIGDFYHTFNRRRRETDFAMHYVCVSLHEVGHVLADWQRWECSRWFASPMDAQLACHSSVTGEDRAGLPPHVDALVELCHHQPVWMRACLHLHARARVVGGMLGLPLSRIITRNYGNVPGWKMRYALSDELFHRMNEPIAAVLDSSPPQAWTDDIVRPFAATLAKTLKPLSQSDQRKVVGVITKEVRELL